MKLLLVFSLTIVLSTGSALAQPDQTHPLCTVRFEEQIRGQLRASDSPQEIDTFELSCHGHIHGRLEVSQGRQSWIQAELARHNGHVWETVDHGHNIVFRANPGRYRYRLIHSGPAGVTPHWKLHWSKPR